MLKNQAMESIILKDKMKELVLLYRDAIGKAAIHLSAKSLIEPGFQSGPTKGFLDQKDNISFWFHGFSCDINLNGLVILVEFGLFDRLDLIKPNRLLTFIDRNEAILKQKYPFDDSSEVELYLEQLVEEGFLFTEFLPYYDQVYILPDDYYAHDKLRWIDAWGDEQATKEHNI